MDGLDQAGDRMTLTTTATSKPTTPTTMMMMDPNGIPFSAQVRSRLFRAKQRRKIKGTPVKLRTRHFVLGCIFARSHLVTFGHVTDLSAPVFPFNLWGDEKVMEQVVPPVSLLPPLSAPSSFPPLTLITTPDRTLGRLVCACVAELSTPLGKEAGEV